MDWLLYVGIAALGALGGFLGHRFLSGTSKKQQALETEVENLQEQMSDYKSDVNQHFEETARLFNGMTEQYQAIYHHLAKGAGTLCNDQDEQTKLSAPVWQAALVNDSAGQADESKIQTDAILAPAPASSTAEVTDVQIESFDTTTIESTASESEAGKDFITDKSDNIIELAEQIVDAVDAEEIPEPPRDYADVPDSFESASSHDLSSHDLDNHDLGKHDLDNHDLDKHDQNNEDSKAGESDIGESSDKELPEHKA